LENGIRVGVTYDLKMNKYYELGDIFGICSRIFIGTYALPGTDESHAGHYGLPDKLPFFRSYYG
jgi:hypothetical protein